MTNEKKDGFKREIINKRNYEYNYVGMSVMRITSTTSI